MAKKKLKTNLIVNRRARFDFSLEKQITVGIALTGAEVRAVRDGHVSLRGSYVTAKNGELWLTNASFTLPSTSGKHETVVDTSSRKLLAKKNEIKDLLEAKDNGHTIVPIHMTTSTRYIKLAIAAAKGKKLHDKRETIKKRDLEREQKRLAKN